jgi:MYXO-CTERM domain-containing protein
VRGLLAVLVVLWANAAQAATLPPHGSLRILVVGDAVNPNGLSDAELTQPGDIPVALDASDSGLTLTAPVTLVDSQCIDDALAALAGAERPDVVVYFAHRPALGCNASDQEAALVAAFDTYLRAGGGIVVFHHGMFTFAGKQAILQLLGATASSLDYNTTVGQRVFDVAPGHFVTANATSYTGTANLTGAGPVPSGSFQFFDNVPDERYPQTQLLVEPGEQREVLFASDSGGTRVLGYSLVRTGWTGRVVWYQPAEFQPNALDNRAGVNFQILANAIVYAAHREPGGQPAGDAGITGDAGQDPEDPAGGGGCCDTSRAPPWPAALLALLALRRRRR